MWGHMMGWGYGGAAGCWGMWLFMVLSWIVGLIILYLVIYQAVYQAVRRAATETWQQMSPPQPRVMYQQPPEQAPPQQPPT